MYSKHQLVHQVQATFCFYKLQYLYWDLQLWLFMHYNPFQMQILYIQSVKYTVITKSKRLGHTVEPFHCLVFSIVSLQFSR